MGGNPGSDYEPMDDDIDFESVLKKGCVPF